MKNHIPKKGLVEYNMDMFHKAFEFSQKKVYEYMVSMKDMISCDIVSSSIYYIQNMFTESG
ncbi:hypothetical protein [Blattabacterium cuenoti]|uniref:hypothetical protein n=1 Tax=Blattabacterium cuenoti TaxID=1653831 RepID=UPI001EEC7DFE|nr:hypothetical protein [Blattabacterium cuenoti]